MAAHSLLATGGGWCRMKTPMPQVDNTKGFITPYAILFFVKLRGVNQNRIIDATNKRVHISAGVGVESNLSKRTRFEIDKCYLQSCNILAKAVSSSFFPCGTGTASIQIQCLAISSLRTARTASLIGSILHLTRLIYPGFPGFFNSAGIRDADSRIARIRNTNVSPRLPRF